MPERYREAHRNGLERFKATGEARVVGKAVELHGLRKDGSEFPLDLSLASWGTDQGQFFSSIIRDITERKQAEATLNERAQLATLGADVGIALTQSGTLRSMMQNCTEAIVARLDAAFARIWTLSEDQSTLELQASAGMYTHIDGGP